jgi:hypothetical protein
MLNSLKKFVIQNDIPTENELNILWENLKLKKINKRTKSAQILTDRIKSLYSNGGVELNKYKIVEKNHFNYYLLKDKHFVENIYRNKYILNDRAYLNFKNELPKINIKEHFTDIYTLSGNLARIIAYGGAYNNGIGQDISWEIATNFVKNEFGNRFEEFDCYYIEIENSEWFYNIAWDYSIIIVDKRNTEIVFMDITDTD